MIPDLRVQPGPHVFVADLSHPVLDTDDRHHLAKSLRLRDGDPLSLSDANGSWCTATFGEVVHPTSQIYTALGPQFEIGLGVALTKSAKPEFAVQKATELGIDRIVIFGADHSVVRWDHAKIAKSAVRLRRVAREAAMQSHRVTIPEVQIVADLDELVQSHGVQAHGVDGLARADFGGTEPVRNHRFVVVGPEGGWSDRERNVVPNAVDLGPTVLRAETAAVVASSELAKSRSTLR